MRILVAAILVFFANSAFASDTGVQNAAKAFYDIYMQEHPMALPDDPERVKFDPALSPTLITLLKKADEAEETYAEKTHNESPPLIEGDLFTSNFEGTTSYSLGACDVKQQTASCTVDLIYVDDQPREAQATAPPEPLHWQDTVYLVKTSGGWKVDNIGYGGTWDFGNHGKLTDVLKDAVRSAKEQN